MNLDDLQRKLICVARANPPGDRVPYAFEKRILARLTEKPAIDESAVWAGALWRAAAPCIAIMVVLSAWSYFAPPKSAPSDLSQEIDNTVLAAVDQEPPSDSVR